MIRVLLSAALVFVALSSSAQSVGTGFFITRDGHIATNYHVIEKSKSISIKDYYNNTYLATVVATDVANDLAIIKIDGKEKNSSYAKINRSDNVLKGQRVFTLGFPNISLQGTEVKYTDGAISSIAGILDQPNSFQISVPIQPGNSGGPLVDEAGNVIGVIVAKLSTKAALITSGSFPENINYAIKSNYLIELARSKRVPLDSEIQNDRSAISKTISQIESTVVLIKTEATSSKLEFAEGAESKQKITKTKNFRIAILPPNAYKTNKGFFEAEADSLKRWRATALNFAYINSIDLVIFEGGAYVKDAFELQLQEIKNKTQISFERYRNPKVFYVESRRVFEDSGLPLATLDQKFFQYAKLIGADIILKEAVYSSSNLNISDNFLEYLKGSTVANESIIQKQANVKLINTSMIFSTQRYKDLTKQYNTNVATQMYLKVADEKIRQLAFDNNIDLVFQVESIIPASLDITFELIRSIDENK